MKLKNVLIVVKGIERSRQFYHDLNGFELVLDNDGNMILKEFLGKDIISEKNSGELYFEKPDIEGFIEKYYPEVKHVNRFMTHSRRQKVNRFYDSDGNLIEIGALM